MVPRQGLTVALTWGGIGLANETGRALQIGTDRVSLINLSSAGRLSQGKGLYIPNVPPRRGRDGTLSWISSWFTSSHKCSLTGQINDHLQVSDDQPKTHAFDGRVNSEAPTNVRQCNPAIYHIVKGTTSINSEKESPEGAGLLILAHPEKKRKERRILA